MCRHTSRCRKTRRRVGNDRLAGHQRPRGRRRGNAAPGRGGDRGPRLCAEPHRPRADLAEDATIGLIVPDVVNPFFSPVVRGAETTARKAGYRVLLCNSEGDLQAGARIYRGPGLAPGRRPAARAGERSLTAQRLSAAAPEFPGGPDRSRLARSRLRPGRQRQRLRRAAPGRAPDRGRPSRHRPRHRRRRHVDRTRTPAGLSRGTGRGRHSLSRGTGRSAPPSTRSAAIAPRSRS